VLGFDDIELEHSTSIPQRRALLCCFPVVRHQIIPPGGTSSSPHQRASSARRPAPVPPRRAGFRYARYPAARGPAKPRQSASRSPRPAVARCRDGTDAGAPLRLWRGCRRRAEGSGGRDRHTARVYLVIGGRWNARRLAGSRRERRGRVALSGTCRWLPRLPSNVHPARAPAESYRRGPRRKQR
jgi:hypothetical protein